MSFELVGILPGPVHNIRSNNPHPRRDFLEPKHLKEDEAKARLEAQVQHAVNELDRTRVQEAVQEYLDKVKAEKKNIPPKIPHATFNTMPRKTSPVGGMVRSKTMVEPWSRPIQDMEEIERQDDIQRLERQKTYFEEGETHDEPEFENDNVRRKLKSCSPGPSSPPIRTRVVKRPITPTFYREHWVTWRTETPPEPGIRDKPIKWVHKSNKSSTENRIKRVHTPPTPPPGHRHKSMATDMTRRTPSPSTAMRQRIRSKSCPPPQEKPQIYRVQHENTDDGNYVDEYVEYNSPPQTPMRPKTAGPMIARSMIEHPRMQNWMNGATDYEKEVAYNLLHTLNGGKGPEMAAKTNNIQPRPNRAATKTKRPTVPKPTLLQRTASSPNLKSPDLDTKGVDQKSLKTWMKKFEKHLEECPPRPSQTAPPERLNYSTKVDVKSYSGTPQPHEHQPRIMTPEAYTHENSHFFLTGRPTRGHFVIAPDWVSEGASHRRLLRQARENKLRRQRKLAISV